MKLVYKFRYVLSTLVILSIFSCSSSSGGDDTPPPPPPMAIPPPSATTLIFPEDDTECNTGVVVNDTQSNVTFEWNFSENTDSYEVNLLNLNTNISTTSVFTTNQASIVIDRGTPYEWFVVSRAAGTNDTATSLRFRFYNEGIGVENYAPFPAEAISPERGANISATTSVDLEWVTSDIDDDIQGYEVLLDTNTNPATSIGLTTMSNLDNVAVNSGNTYYWKVITTDEAGNTSTSEIFQFKIL